MKMMEVFPIFPSVMVFVVSFWHWFQHWNKSKPLSWQKREIWVLKMGCKFFKYLFRGTPKWCIGMSLLAILHFHNSNKMTNVPPRKKKPSKFFSDFHISNEIWILHNCVLPKWKIRISSFSHSHIYNEI